MSSSPRADVDPLDVTVLLLGTLLVSTGDDAPGHTERLLDLVMDALRPATPS